ncbi:MAG: C25 family cysteine peptidase [candidate division WOR-3 bacterium]
MKLLILANLVINQFSLTGVQDNRVLVRFEGPEVPFVSGFTENGQKVIFLAGTALINEDANSPFIPYYELKVALNCLGRYFVKVTPKKTLNFENINIPTIPRYSNDGLSIHFSVYSEGIKNFPPVLYSGEVEIINGVPTAKILFTPYSYDINSRTLTYTQEALIEVHCKEKTNVPQLEAGWYDALYKENFFGYKGRIAPSKSIYQNPFQGAVLWFQIKITEEGYYSVSYGDLKKAGLPYPVEITRIAVFSRRSDTLPSSLNDTISQLIKIPIEILDKNNNGVLDENDEIRFYSKSTKGIRHSLQGSESAESLIVERFYYFDNPYTDTFSLWLAIGPEPQHLREKNLNLPNLISSLTTYYHHEKNVINVAWKGLLWVGEEIIRQAGNPSASLSLNFSLSSPESPHGFIKVRYSGGENQLRTLKISLNGIDSLIDGSFYGYALRTRLFRLTSLKSSNTLTISITSSNPNTPDRVYLDYFTVFYRKNTTLLADETAFYTLSDTLLARIPISSNIIGVFDISNPHSPVKLKIKSENNFSYISDSLYPGKIYFFASTIKKPLKIEMTPGVGSTYELTSNPDYIAITPYNFVSSLYKYKTYRERKMLKIRDNYWSIERGKVEIISIEEIMRDFAFGTYDPVAIRNFLKYVYERFNGNLIYVGLWGDACYDYKNINGTSGNLVPAYEPFLSTYIDEEKGAKDDFYIDFNGDGYPDILIGRIPFRTKEQLSIYLDKLFKYEESAIFSSWRTRFLLVADDEYGESGQPTEIGWHIPYANIIRRDTVMTPNFCEVRLVYETSYGIRNNILDLKRRGLEAKQDFIRKFNDGNFIMTYFGHGNPVQLTHEQLLLLQDLTQINSNYKNPICSFLSCKVGAFTRENPPLGIAEYMAIYNQAIGTIGSTIGQFVTLNAIFGQNIHRTLSDRKLHPLGELIARAKLTSLSLTYYHLFGDPATIVYLPPADSILNFEIPETLLIGRVNNAYINNADLKSEYYSLLYHKPYNTRYVNPGNQNVQVEYLGENKILFRGPYRPRGLPDSVSFFLSGTADTGTGFVFTILKKDVQNSVISALHRSNLTAILQNITTVDKEGPVIKVYINGKEIDSIAYTGTKFDITLELIDSSGINLYNVFGDEKGIMLIDGSNFIDLTPFFEYYPNSYTMGQLRFPYLASSTGEKKLRIVAYDNLNNFSQKSFKVIVEANPRFLDELTVAPNPVRSSHVYFVFRLYQPARIKIQIFTVNGRLIFQTQELIFSPGYKQIPWNLRDVYGQIVSNGIYIVKLIAQDENGKKEEYFRAFVIGK